MSGTELIAGLPDVVTMFAAVVAARIAWLGLSTWKDQTKWNADAELAKRLLDALYKHSTALKRVRFPAIYPHEREEATAGKELPKEPVTRRYFETASVYQTRWNSVISAKSELQPLIFEAQVIWDSDLRSMLQPLWALEDELFRVVRTFLESMNPEHSPETRAEFAQMKLKMRNILYFTDEATDEFNADYEKALQPLMLLLREKLGRR